MIIPVYKPYGESTHQLAHKVGKLYDEKATHTGTLDPAAEGVVVVVTGKDRFDKQVLANTKKVYIAEVLMGISTDTHDLIGLPISTTVVSSNLTNENVQGAWQKLTGTYSQTQPDFSAKRIQGKSSFDLAKAGKALQPVENSIIIDKIDLLSSIKVDIDAVKKHLFSRLDHIIGDFRQTEIKESWSQISNDRSQQLSIHKIEVVCSKRTYIRALVRDFSSITGIPAVLYSLVRTKNGPYSVSDCVCLV